MDDKELLMLAAKAAGMPGHFSERTPEDGYPGYTCGITNGTQLIFWNPLTDDGDALRLAAHLKIDIEWKSTQLGAEPEVEAYRTELDSGSFCASEHENGYRRAIVRAAAEIGKAMTNG